ncbi:exportin-5 isoform X2 [Gopherus flavomarginatus]|uniref:exportin-5 isoform X2 n=1 Tax=Gopherus flavomarginatus TaxID=286002 RepID=UPI0021CBC554|nr:exportin-5 isoform X2 [Gopherus flavomarginatus]
MSAEQVSSLCEQLVKAVTVIMDPASTQRYRLEALKFCEEFKEKCPICVPCGLKLAEKTQTAIVRHFGLQILEHVVKFRWNSMPRLEKVYLKNNVMGLISNGTQNILEEESHIKDVLSRIVVEMIKREWPQHWPDMLKELDTLSKQGETQTELVMFILLRLAEDVVTFQTLPTQRRRDIQQTLTQNMEKIFSFLLTTLQQNVNKYRRMVGAPQERDALTTPQKTDLAQEPKAQANCRVGIAALNTLAGYIDWVAMSHITADNCKLLEMLCLLLNEPELQVGAAECLLIAVSRKGKLEDRKPLMVLFGDVAMHYILSAAQTADGEGLVEKHYVFLKRLCQVLCALGSQLCALVGSDSDVDTPANLGKYLDSFLAFTTHPSQFLRSSTQITWGALFRHEILSRDPLLLTMISKYLRASMTNLVKVGFPSKTDSPSCEYSRFDFDSDEDFNAFFNSFRAQQGEVMRMACRLDPRTGFQMAGEWLKYQLASPVDIGPMNSKTGEGLCSIFSPSFVQWDAMTFFSESVISQMFRTLDKEEIPVNDGIELLQLVLNFETKDPLILSCVLTNVSALFPFVTYRPEYLPQVLSKLFTAVTFEVIEESKAPRTRAVKNVRRHACSSIIKMCRDYPQLVLPNFEMLYNHVKQLLSNELLLTQMEKCALMEALVLISNQFKDYQRQKVFLEELMSPVANLWLSEEMQRVLSDPEAFISYVGADNKIADPVLEDPSGLNRSRISFCVYTILGVVKRARWPTTLEEAKAGGFVIGCMPSGNPIYRNPCTEQVLKLLDNLLALISRYNGIAVLEEAVGPFGCRIYAVCSCRHPEWRSEVSKERGRTHNNLYMPEMVAKLGETFAKALDMLEVEKNAILGLPQPLLELYDSPVYKTILERMQGFFCTLYDNCFHILGNAGPSMQQDFYTVDGLASQFLNSAFVNLNNIPDYRLRPMLRVFVKPLVLSCPSEHYETLLCPMLGPLFTYLHVRLSQKWQVISQRSMLCEEDAADDNPESQEMLEEQLVRLLTREVMDLITVCCVSKKGAAEHNSSAAADGDDDEMMSTDVTPPSSAELTELGKCLMKQEDVCTALLITAYRSLSWKDTLSCQRTTTQLCWPLLKQVLTGNLLPDAVTWFFTGVLKGLQTHGQHDGCMAALVHLAFQIYEALRPRYAELKAVMEQIPEIQKESLEQFDSKLLNPTLLKVADKRRKDNFKRLIAGCIGKPLGEQFRKEVHIRNLPSLFKKVKPSLETDVLENNEDGEGLAALFEP